MARSDLYLNAAITVVLALLGCDKPKTSTEDPIAIVAKPATGSSKNETTGLTPESANKVLDHWLRTQNEGNFSAYSKLYAQKFVGVKRAGPRVTRYDHDGWLKDRGRLFDKPMQVTAAQIDIAVFGTTAEIQFSQKWKSGSYEDVGSKRLLLVWNDDAFEIAREEMLESEVVGSPSDREAGNLYFLVSGGLELAGVPAPKGRGDVQLIRPSTGQAVWEARAPLDEQTLDPDVRRLKGMLVRVDNQCEAKITGFELTSRVTPHFGQTNQWTCFASPPDCTPTPDPEIAAQVFDMGKQAVVALLDGCHEGRVARLSSAPRLIESTSPGNRGLESVAREAFAQLREVNTGDEPGWWKAHLAVTSFVHPTSHQELVVASSSNRQGCNGARAFLQVWTVVDGKLSPLSSSFRDATARRAFDADADGSLELLLESNEPDGTEWILWDPETGRDRLTQSFSYRDCPC